jgi:hypothetical protein
VENEELSMPLDLAVADYVRQLRRVGLRPSERLVQHIVQAGPAAVGPLLELALETDLLYKEEPECYAPLHALRLLGELRPPEMITPLLRALPLEQDDETNLPDDWETEVPQIIGRLGAAAVAPLWAIADDAGFAPAGRSAALNALTYATAIDPAIRDEVIAGLRERLARSDDTTFSSHLVIALANLGVAEAYSDVMRLYREGRIDQEIIPAGAARQLLLTSSDKRLACVRHPLWERYDQHGPFPQEREA